MRFGIDVADTGPGRAGAAVKGGEKGMMSMPVNVIIKVKSLEEAKEVLSNLKEIKEANPYEVFKTTIEIDPWN